MHYLLSPPEITLDELRATGASFSPRAYKGVFMGTSTVERVGDLLQSHDNGIEVGSLAYVPRSPYNFIRTKALQDYSCLTQPLGGAIAAITPRAYTKATASSPGRIVRDNDILYARGGSVGEVALAYGCGQATLSGHMIRLEFTENSWYCFAFMKHPVCKLQQQPQVKGSIRALDNFTISTLLDCLIPFPNQPDSERAIAYVSALMQAIVDKEKAIREKNAQTHADIEAELLRGQTNGKSFQYALPTLDDVRTLTRFDARMYAEPFQRQQFLVHNYQYGFTDYEGLGLETGRGQNLQLSNIGKSIYSDTERPGFYRLLLPTNITDYGTASQYAWLGNKRRLDPLREGDIVFGGEATFRCAVVCDALSSPTISNIHAITLRSDTMPIYQKVFAGAWLRFLSRWGYTQAIAVGGQGGSLAMGYFRHVLFPKFPDAVQAAIARLYHNPAAAPADAPTLATFTDWHRRWNESLGIWELDREMKSLRRTLAAVQEDIIQGRTVTVPLPDAAPLPQTASLFEMA